MERLQDIGAWLDVNGASIYGTTAGPFTYLSWGAATRKGDQLFLHVYDWPEDGKLRVPLTSKVKAASLLVDPNKSLDVTSEAQRVIIELPDVAPDAVASVVVLQLAEEPATLPIASDGKRISASSEAASHPATHAADGTGHEVWESATAGGESYLEYDLGEPTLLQACGVDEPDRWPRYRQTIRLEVETDAGWQEVFTVNTKGHGLKKKFEPVSAQRVRLLVAREEGAPGIAEWQLIHPIDAMKAATKQMN